MLNIDFSFIALSSLASFIACLFSTIAGGGAGLILLPVLVFCGLPFVNALACHKLAVGFIGIGSTLRFARENLIDWRNFWWSALSGVPFVIAGTYYASVIPSDVMKPVLGLVIIVMVVISASLKKSGLIHRPDKLTFKKMLLVSALLAPVAFYNGWLSAGSGVFVTLIYVCLLRYDQLHATATMLAANGIVWNMVGAIAHVVMGHVIWTLAPGLILGAIAGSYAGASIGIIKGNFFIKVLFLISAAITGLMLIEPWLHK